ncbi:MAG TPA: hypothetical protein VMT88_07655 [Actinomycetes bacterium]|nr:hypothetical protein [Actinomycetes bacterium]
MDSALRVLVPDVDEALPGWASLGYEVKDRWGPPFAILTGPGIDIWLSGPQTSAALICEELDGRNRAAASTRLVTVTEDFESRIDELKAAGWTPLTPDRSGPGGRQALLHLSGTVIECFSPG